MPTLRRSSEGHKPIAGEPNFLPAIEVVIVGRQLDPRLIAIRHTAAVELVEQIVGSDQMLIDRIAQMRQVSAAERTVPVAAIALAAIELGAGLIDQVAVRPAATASCNRRLTICIRQYISLVSGYFALKFRQ